MKAVKNQMRLLLEKRIDKKVVTYSEYNTIEEIRNFSFLEK